MLRISFVWHSSGVQQTPPLGYLTRIRTPSWRGVAINDASRGHSRAQALSGSYAAVDSACCCRGCALQPRQPKHMYNARGAG